ncbi:MAG: hypothetical protein SVY41_00005, partial [Candidatus Nanohaloarchaea archaeon]|nr:hypothetical protein [Candidatus Nanohaloarchaea archaeon]
VYPETAQGGIVISATARDTATQIIGARFRIEGPGDETVTDGRMNAVNGAYNRQQEAVRRVVDLDQFDLEDGDYTVFLMTRDAAGHDFEGFGTDFTLDSTLNASLDIQDTVFRQEIGTTTTFTVPVSNTGEVAEQVSFTAETSADTSIDPATRRIGTGETKQFELAVTLPNSTSALGNHSVTLTADGLSTADTVTTEIIGQPHPPRQQEIQADFQALVDRLAELNQSRQTWNVSSDAAEQYEDTAGRVSTVRQLLSEGRYTAAAAELAAAEQELEQTQSTISGEITRARLGAVASTAAKLLAVIAVAGLVYGGYRLIPEEEGYHPDSGYVHRPGGKHPLRLQIEGWWRRLQARRVESSEDRREKTVDRWEGYGS